VAEGPIGAAHRGSWLVSARQSYIDHLVRHLTSHSVSFGFSDVQSRLGYDLSSSQHVDVTAVAGHSEFVNDPSEPQEIDTVYDATNASVVGVVAWRLTKPRFVVTQRLIAAENHFRNENHDGLELDHGQDRQLAWRADATVAATTTVQIDAGGEFERRDDSRVRRRLAANRVTLVQLDDYRATADNPAAYAAVKWTALPSLTLAPGIRIESWTLTGQQAATPWMQAEWRITAPLKIRGSAGRYQQFSDFDKVLGASGGDDLQPEQAAQYDLGVEDRLSPTLRVSATVYDRQEHAMLRRPGSETRVVNGRGIRGLASAKYENRLDGFARGVEVMLQRTVPGPGVSGWLSYAYGRNRYHDVVSGETFWGDNDQRHTLNAYGMYRHSDRLSFVAKLRVGSNFPIPGYYAKVPDTGSFVLADVRNSERLPLYARLDLRANRAFNWSRSRLTLFAEVINVFDRANYRFEPPSVNVTTKAVGTPFDSMFPVIPSVGFLIEF
jgi:outer membrane receptor for ferrienterochelin and colicin